MCSYNVLVFGGHRIVGLLGDQPALGVYISFPSRAHLLTTSYIQADGKGAVLKPFVWIALLFVGPTISSVAVNYYIFLMTRALVRTESLLTQLMFDHALRLRMRDTAEDEEKKEEQANDSSPRINVEDVDETAESSNGETTEVASSDGGKGKSANKKEAADKEAAQAKGQGLAGRINVLMAADVESVVEGMLCDARTHVTDK